MNIFSYDDYRAYLQEYITAQKGLTKKDISAAVGISASLFSQILNGDRNLNSDQAYRFCIFAKLNNAEISYLLLLLDYANAGTNDLKLFIKKRINEMLKDIETNPRIRQGHTKTNWSQEFVSVFYSSWHFSAIYSILVTEKSWSIDRLSIRLALPKKRVQQIMTFFEDNQIVLKLKNSEYQLTHIGFVNIAGKDQPTHQAAVLHNTKNFRRKAIDILEETQFNKESTASFQTLTAVISKDDFISFKQDVKKLVDKFFVQVEKEKFETVACLNIDFFEI